MLQNVLERPHAGGVGPAALRALSAAPPRWLIGTARERLLGLVIVLAAELLLNGVAIPRSNEWTYLLQLQAAGSPELWAHDWSLHAPDARHAVFNALVGPLTRFCPPVLLAWLGRVACWTALTVCLQTLGAHFRLRPAATTLAIVLWLAIGQGPVAGEWIYGTFEAKCCAYITLLLALLGLMRGRWVVPALLLGATFSLHPAIGLWGGTAAALAALPMQRTRREWLLAVAAVLTAALPGFVPLVLAGGGASFDDLRYECLVWMPIHLDPFSWAARDVVGLGLLVLFNVLAARGWPLEAGLQFLNRVQLWIAAWFGLGLLAAALELYSFTALMPFRMCAVLTPLLFFLTLLRVWHEQGWNNVPAGTAIVGLCGLMGLTEPLSGFVDEVRKTDLVTRSADGGCVAAMQWVARETPRDAVVLCPPHRRDAHWHSQRAQVVSWWLLPAGRETEWRARLAAHVLPDGGEATYARLRTEYDQLPEPQIRDIARTYGGDYIVTTAPYDFPRLHTSGDFHVYRIPQAPTQ